jgi:transcriptional regulator with XRE-family HTH domain
MIATATIEQIGELLRSGSLSQRKIARCLGVSRGTVNAIALGKRPDYEARRRRPAHDITAPSGPFVRCPTCGARAQMPCLACQIRLLAVCRRRAG